MIGKNRVIEMGITLTDPGLPKVRIKVNLDKCPTPMGCPVACYKQCPQGVFAIAANPVKTYTKWYLVDNNRPGDYILMAINISKCTGCMLCEENCPYNAIKIKIKPPKKESEEESS